MPLDVKREGKNIKPSEDENVFVISAPRIHGASATRMSRKRGASCHFFDRFFLLIPTARNVSLNTVAVADRQTQSCALSK
jgi:hypothetical protein